MCFFLCDQQKLEQWTINIGVRLGNQNVENKEQKRQSDLGTCDPRNAEHRYRLLQMQWTGVDQERYELL